MEERIPLDHYQTEHEYPVEEYDITKFRYALKSMLTGHSIKVKRDMILWEIPYITQLREFQKIMR